MSATGWGRAVVTSRPVRLRDRIRLRVLLHLLGGISLLALLACATNPATGKRQVNLFSESQEIELGREAERELAGSWRLLENPPLQAYVESLGQKLAAASERPRLPWRFQVVDDPVVNAFALPGGAIFVTRGLLAHLRSEAELATVLGHEVAHVTAQHAVHRISKQQLAVGGLLLGAIVSPEVANAADLAELGLGLLFLKYSRDDERQADSLGLRYLRRLGYDPRAAPEVFTVLEAVSSREGGGRLPGWLATHPHPAERRDRLAREVAGEAAGLVGREELFRATENLPIGPDPRDGFWLESTWIGPRLRLRWTVPARWERHAETKRIASASPEGDAMLELRDLAGQDPSQAAREFARRLGAGAGSPRPWRSREFHGQEVPFEGGDPGNEIRGVARFLNVDGRTVRLLAAARSDRWADRARALENGLARLEPLSDARFLDVEPQRLVLVELPQAMTFAAFLEAYPSEADRGVVALINGVARPEELLAKGTLLRRVVGPPLEEWVRRLRPYL